MSEVSKTRIIVDRSGLAKIREISIRASQGPDQGKEWSVADDPVRIGTTEGCEVRLTDTAVSGMHLELRRTDRGLLVRDLGSTNGTWLDGRRITGIYESTAVSLKLGETELNIRLLDTDRPVELAIDDRFGELVGQSVVMRALFAKLAKLAKTDVTVLATGETGCGKELVAAAIRDHSPRANGPFVVVDCGALPDNLIESELFGHEKGAFTGADRSRSGAFERADGGTIFLDEIGELPLGLQPSLLGVLERREARRVGGDKTHKFDVRVIAATNRDLAKEIERGSFRADLYYRLAVIEVSLPPLRQRPDDVPLLIEHFLDQLPGTRPTLTPETIETLKAYPWPGNVRELKNVIERAALLEEAPVLRPRKAPPRDDASGQEPVADLERPFKDQKQALIADFEERYVTALLESTGGNVAAAARKAGIDRMYVYKLMSRYDIGGRGA